MAAGGAASGPDASQQRDTRTSHPLGERRRLLSDSLCAESGGGEEEQIGGAGGAWARRGGGNERESGGGEGQPGLAAGGGGDESWQDPGVVGERREGAHATLFPFESRAHALAGQRQASERFVSLDGLWKFQWARSWGERAGREFVLPGKSQVYLLY
jgi:hypothetical protein